MGFDQSERVRGPICIIKRGIAKPKQIRIGFNTQMKTAQTDVINFRLAIKVILLCIMVCRHFVERVW